MPEITKDDGVIFKSPVTADEDHMDKKLPLGTLGFLSFDSKMVPMQPSDTSSFETHIRKHGATTRSSSLSGAALAASVHTISAPRVPRSETNPTLTQARKGNNWTEWNEAIRKEISMLNDLGCFEWKAQSEIPPKKQIDTAFFF
jgi:hypothetical protein